MIKIEVFCNSEDKVIGFEVKGHALGQGRVDEYGLVCCGVSILTITTVNGITDYLKVMPKELQVDNGWLRFVLDVDSGGIPVVEDRAKTEQIDALLGSMVLGLQSLAKDYNKHIQLKKRRWTSC